ncbi:DUF262 domain-containing protein [Rhodonellum sp.]|uniref:DUF262 domain-containing protein n=1 Tax=Rhodonellum sp. TaxID=2231180 RepID=UPI00271BF24A|nr:DUF262 domain-containing protein [Rhodonellum sp.]MDO9554642.1 DUF262 domain-containing protein [Rhodonellum sp.]
MRTGKYCFRDLFVNRYIDQIVIPEIQRDYVWQKEQVNGLIHSLLEDFTKYQNSTIDLGDIHDPQLKADFEEFYKKRNYSSNIGFIYAYCDEELPGRYFLIDGQQRITTVFLMLLTLANRNESLKEKFKGSYLIERSQKLDFRVRDNAQDFFRHFCLHLLEKNFPVKEQAWFFDFYNNDETIKNLEANHRLLDETLNTQSIDEQGFYKYLEEFTEFWYFDTNVSEQGEELYIYMNARGEQMQGNENIKAELLSELPNQESKNYYGKIWEEWQDFFWINRKGNQNADPGFNEFLACISGLENYIKGDTSNFYSKEEFDKLKEIRAVQVVNPLSIGIIEKYFNVLKFLEDTKSQFCSLYNYSSWVDKCLNEFWEILNSKGGTNWYANYEDDNRATERNRMVFLWSILFYFRKRLKKIPTESQGIDFIIENFRFLRMVFLRYKNYNRSVKSIKDTVNFILEDSIGVLDPTDNSLPLEIENLNLTESADSKIRNSEEIGKNKILNQHPGSIQVQREHEELIWEIEDHPYNLEGKDVGGTNISHLIDFEIFPDLNELRQIKNTFHELFPKDSKVHLNVQNALLFYGEYWHQEKPKYYKNLKFDNWRRIIRGNGYSDQSFGKSTFIRFFNEFIISNKEIEDFIKQKTDEANLTNPSSLGEKILWYSIRLKTKMWGEGNFIVISSGSPCSLPNWTGMDENFPDEHIFYNTKGNLKGGAPKKLSEMLKTEQSNIINMDES